MENKGNQQPGIFDLLNEWSLKLPKNSNEFAESSISTLSQIGQEFRQRCTDLNQSSASPSSNSPQASPLEAPQVQERKSESEMLFKKESTAENEGNGANNMIVVKTGQDTHENLKPPFAFDLESDSSHAGDRQTFNCVYDFCVCLEQYCRSEYLDIDKVWYKLLIACTSHNYDRYMWVLATFQNADKFGITWKQVIRRLMSKFDDPQRMFKLESKMNTLQHLLSIHPGQHIFRVNQDFTRYAEELALGDQKTISIYMKGLPEDIRAVIQATIDFDEATNFRYNLADIQQRAAVCISADQGSYVFYSKSAHLATSLEVEKVSNDNCEFHILGDHTTTSCPDYTIVKYPCMDFMPSVVVATLNDTTNLTKSQIKSSQDAANSSSDNDSAIGTNINPDITMTEESAIEEKILIAKEEQMDEIDGNNVNDKLITNVVLQEAQPSQGDVMTKDQSLELPKAPVKAKFTTSLHKQADSSSIHLNTSTTTNQTTPSNYTTSSTSFTNNNNYNNNYQFTAGSTNVGSSHNNQTLNAINASTTTNFTTPSSPVTQTQQVVTTRFDATQSSMNPQPFEGKKAVSVQRVHITPSGLTAIRSVNRYELSNDNTVSLSNGNSYIPNKPVNSKRQRSESPESGCYIHGKYSNHTTKQCRQAQLVIPSRNNMNDNQQYPSTFASRANYNNTVCRYCKGPFSPGHLKVCSTYRAKHY